MKKSLGFTLIELMIVIAILGALAVGLLVLLDPIEQNNRARDTGVRNTAIEISRSLDRFYSTAGGYPCYDTSAAIIADLVNSGELKSTPTAPAGYTLSTMRGVGVCAAAKTQTKPWTCWNFTSKAFKLEANASYTTAAGAGTNPVATAGCTASKGTPSSTCTQWCIQ